MVRPYALKTSMKTAIIRSNPRGDHDMMHASSVYNIPQIVGHAHSSAVSGLIESVTVFFYFVCFAGSARTRAHSSLIRELWSEKVLALLLTRPQHLNFYTIHCSLHNSLFSLVSFLIILHSRGCSVSFIAISASLYNPNKLHNLIRL